MVNERAGQVLTILAAGFVLGLAVYLMTRGDGSDNLEAAVPSTAAVVDTTPTQPGTEPETPTTTLPAPSTTTFPSRERAPGTVPGWTVGQPWGTTVGVTMFRGNPTRSFHGTGPVPDSPTVAWRYPDAQMCSSSSEGGVSRVWCLSLIHISEPTRH